MTQGSQELTVCDIIGDFGLYQWSLTLFATIYSALPSLTVIVGPIWTPDLFHLCKEEDFEHHLGHNGTDGLTLAADFSSKPHQCFTKTDSRPCREFIYDDANYGKMLTNTFDLVCDRRWLTSSISSSALTGMLISSVTLGLLSDRLGRKKMILIGVLISILATIAALLAHNYILLNICIMLMSFSQVGVANALSVLVMESTSPRWRFVAIFQYGMGWGLGQVLVPTINELTKNYQYFLVVVLVAQIILLPWLHWGVFESIRWLLSESKINQAQIELRRACKWNRRQNGADLAQKIAQVQVQQLRKASKTIETKLAPMKLAEQQLADQELDALGQTIRRSFALANSNDSHDHTSSDSPDAGGDFITSNGCVINTNTMTNEEIQQLQLRQRLPMGLSPTLVRQSFSSTSGIGPNNHQLVSLATETAHRQSIATQALVQLAFKHSKSIQEQEEGKCFLIQMFHRKLRKLTIALMLISVMLESAYYGLIQANKFVGSSVHLNYLTGALSEWSGAIMFMIVLWIFNRRAALMIPLLLSSLACIGIAITYHLIPDSVPIGNDDGTTTGANKLLDIDLANVTGTMDQPGSLVVNETLLQDTRVLVPLTDQARSEALELREQINFWLMITGKLSITVAIQVAATIALEAYPNNLRQSGSGAIIFVGRVGSIITPFLFNDSSPEKTVFKLTLTVLALLGLLVSLMIPCFIRNNKGEELSDRLDEVAD